VRTARLDLVAATYDHLVAEIAGPAPLGAMLDAVVPGDWPPPLNDARSQRFFLEILRKQPSAVGWCVWYIVLRGAPRAVVGNCGFKGEPSEGTVEIGYSVVPAYQRHGYASEATDGLVRWAFGDPRVERVIAETFPDLTASLGVLRTTGFAPAEAAAEPGAVRFVRRRPGS
jgi:ribosomal-protein-alanine N-acetyltransferase